MKRNHLDRRDFIKVGSLAAVRPVLMQQNKGFAEQKSDSDRPVRAIVLGAGNRGNTYSAYAEKFPGELKIVGVAEPIDFRRKRFAKRYDIPPSAQWTTWEHVVQEPKQADVLIITTPDALHHGPAMAGLELGYDLLLEKAIGINWEQVNDVLRKTRQTGRIVGICHVLRYTNFYRNLKGIVDSGILGRLLSVEHTEKISLRHYAHSYIRGNWRSSKIAAPMLLAKSCHDLDILRWVIDRPCRHISSFGDQVLFVEKNAPKGSAKRCTECGIEKECHWSAIKHYHRDRERLYHLAIENHDAGSIWEALETGPFGRCVWHCDNDTVDHQVVNMEFDDSVSATFALGFSPFPGRRTRVNGSEATIIGDFSTGLTVKELGTGKTTQYPNEIPAQFDSGHGGGDFGLVHDFVRAVRQQNPELLASTIEESAESHLMGFTAEKSRKVRQTLPVDMDFYLR